MPFILTTMAGFATLLGIIPIFIKLKDQDKLIAFGCAFASGVMLCVSIIDLIPEGIRSLKANYTGLIVIGLVFIFMVIGIIISLFLEHVIDRVSDGSNLYCQQTKFDFRHFNMLSDCST